MDFGCVFGDAAVRCGGVGGSAGSRGWHSLGHREKAGTAVGEDDRSSILGKIGGVILYQLGLHVAITSSLAFLCRSARRDMIRGAWHVD